MSCKSGAVIETVLTQTPAKPAAFGEKRRAEAEEIIEKEREARRRQREYDAAHAATPEEIERILAENPLPKLKPSELTPHQRIFNKDI